jgi:hypothetical protein
MLQFAGRPKNASAPVSVYLASSDCMPRCILKPPLVVFTLSTVRLYVAVLHYLKVPKCEIFDLFDFNYFDVMKCVYKMTRI